MPCEHSGLRGGLKPGLKAQRGVYRGKIREGGRALRPIGFEASRTSARRGERLYFLSSWFPDSKLQLLDACDFADICDNNICQFNSRTAS
jgi:hypothetical protein